jgi:hypothetical protein
VLTVAARLVDLDRVVIRFVIMAVAITLPCSPQQVR